MDTIKREITVSVQAGDPLSMAGVSSQLHASPELTFATDDNPADVAVVVTQTVDEDTVRVIRNLCRQDATRVVVVVAQPNESGLLAAVEAGASGLLRRSEASAGRLAAAVRSAAYGEGVVSPDLLGRLLRQVGQLQRDVLSPRGLRLSGLTEREANVLRLVADGLSTAEVAIELSYSERTIKNVVRDVVTRFRLRNRSHAVAFALREGLI